jgi:hypothetical protein
MKPFAVWQPHLMGKRMGKWYVAPAASLVVPSFTGRVMLEGEFPVRVRVR